MYTRNLRHCMEIRWKAKPTPREGVIYQLAKDLNVSPAVATLLAQRGIETYDQAKAFFRPQLDDLHNPFLMKDMDKAVERIDRAKTDREKILIYGDYDVDGTTSVSLVYSFFRSLTPHLNYYIPDRYKEGYGVSKAGIEYAIENDFTLIIALDCGTRSNVLIAYAKEKGIDFIVCDHHLPGEELPPAYAMLNPKRPDCTYPYKELSGCGIGYKLIQAYAEKNDLPKETHESYLDLVAVSIASDIVDMRGENRVLAFFGLKKLNENPMLGLQAVLAGYKKKDNYDINDVVFGIGPRINAAGRIADATAAVKVLIERDFTKAMSYAKVLNERNVERKNLDSDITKTAIDLIENSTILKSKKSTVLRDPTWQKGVIGIVASRLVEQFYKPTIIFNETDGMLVGSARSVRDFDIHEAIGSCGDLVEQYGGHKYAAGLSVKAEKFDAFEQRFESIVSNSISDNDLVPEIEFDLALDLDEVTPRILNIIKQMAPFGPGNMLPVFVSRKLKSNGTARVLGDKHLKMVVKHNNQSNLDCIGFNLSHLYEKVSNNNEFDACYSIEENTYNGRTSLQLRLRDVK